MTGNAAVKKRESHLTIEEAKKFCQGIHEKKKSVLSTIHILSDLIEAETLLKNLPIQIEEAKRSIQESFTGYAETKVITDKKLAYCDSLKEQVRKDEESFVLLQEATEKLSEVVQRIKEKNENLAGLKTTIEENKKEKEARTCRIDELNPLVDQLKSETESFTQRVAEIKERVELLQTQRQTLFEEKESVVKDIAELGGKKAKEELVTLKDKNSALQESIEQIHSILKEDAVRIDSKQTDSTAKEGEEEELSALVTTLREEREKLDAVVIPREEVDSLSQELEETVRERETTKEKVDEMVKTIEENIGKKSGILFEIETLTADLSAKTDEYDLFKEKVLSCVDNPERMNMLKERIESFSESMKEDEKMNKNYEEQLKHLNKATDIISVELKGYQDIFREFESLVNTS